MPMCVGSVYPLNIPVPSLQSHSASCRILSRRSVHQSRWLFGCQSLSENHRKDGGIKLGMRTMGVSNLWPIAFPMKIRFEKEDVHNSYCWWASDISWLYEISWFIKPLNAIDYSYKISYLRITKHCERWDFNLVPSKVRKMHLGHPWIRLHGELDLISKR